MEDTNKNKEQEFHTNRIMFYFKNDNIVFPKYKYVNCSHKEWFEKENIDIDKTIRGYKLDLNVYLYIGKDFEIPNITYNMIEQILNIFPDIWHIYLGCQVGEIGEQWKGIKEIKLYNVN